MTRPSAFDLVCLIAGLVLAGSSAWAQPAPLASAGPIALGTSETRVVIAPSRALAEVRGGALVLVLSDLTTDRQPGVLYRVAIAGEGATRSLGYINFFNAASKTSPHFSFALGAKLDASRGLTVAITPAAPPDPAAHPQVGRISIVNQPRP